MTPQEFPEFVEMLEDMEGMTRRSRPLNDTTLKSYFSILKPIPIAVLRRACLALLANEQRDNVFPAPAELKGLCAELMHYADEEARPLTKYELRCGHRDWDAPRGDDGERPQCPTLIPFPNDLKGTDAYYCPQHRALYRGEEERANDDEIDEVFVRLLDREPDREVLKAVVVDRARRRTAGESTTLASLNAVMDTFTAKVYARTGYMKQLPLEEHDLEAIREADERKRAQLTRARAAGLPVDERSSALVAREPGDDDA